MTDDATLLSQYVNGGSQDAFRQLVGRHVDLVFACALPRVGRDSHLAADVTQQVFTDLAQKAVSLSGRNDLSGWLYTAARFTATDVVRAERRRRQREQDALAMNENFSESSSLANWDRVQPLLLEAIDALKPADRTAIVMRYFCRRPFAEIGVELRLSEDAVQKRVERAMEALRSRLQRLGITSTSSAIALALADQSLAAPAGLAAQVATSALAQLGAASAGTSAIAVLSQLMASKITITIATGVVLASLAGIVFEFNTAQRANAAAMIAADQREALERDVSSLKAETARLRREATAAASSAKAPARSAGAADPAKGAASPLSYALTSPQARQAFVNQQVLEAKLRYLRFFKLANLTPDQENRFLGVMREQADSKLDTLEAATAQGLLAPSDSTADARTKAIGMERLNKQAAVSVDQDLHATLGDDAYQQYRQFSTMIPAQTAVSEFAAQLYISAEPLTAGQSQQLEQLIAANPFVRGQAAVLPSNSMGGVQVSDEAFAGSKVQANQQNTAWSAPITDQALTQAELLLTPSQIAALKQFQALQLARMQAAPPHR